MLALVAAYLFLSSSSGSAQATAPSGLPETIVEITVHGNTMTPDEDVRRLAEVDVGAPFTPQLLDEVATRLRATRRFTSVDVRKRFASIDDPSRIALVILVDEGPVSIHLPGTSESSATVVKKRGLGTLFLPVLTAEDAYGFSYGVRFAWPRPLGRSSRVSVPLTWGGERQAAVEVDKRLPTRRLTRMSGGAGVLQRTNPYFDERDTRRRLWGRVEHEIAPHIRVGATTGWQHVRFADAVDHVASAGADVILDKRLDPMLARNAVYGRAAWEHLAFDGARTANRVELEGRGYLGLPRRSILVGRVLRHDADAPLPAYAKSLFGGLGTVRGLRAGSGVGDSLAATSLELLVPVTSPLSVALVGVSVFADAGAAYDKGARLADQRFSRSVGASVWVSATVVRLSVAVAHALGGSTRVLVGGGLTF
ncbi:MAG: POTRA domain-containing protein [Vicinamibacterales bacterium]